MTLSSNNLLFYGHKKTAIKFTYLHLALLIKYLFFKFACRIEMLPRSGFLNYG